MKYDLLHEFDIEKNQIKIIVNNYTTNEKLYINIDYNNLRLADISTLVRDTRY